MSIIAKNIRKSFGNPPVEIIHGVNLHIQKGEFISISGRSGSGKSTLLYILCGLDSPTSGDLLIDNVNYNSLNKKEKSFFNNSKMGFVFQFHYLLPEFTVLENVLMPVLNQKESLNQKSRAKELLALVGMENNENKLPSQLSGGQSQRAAIARALMNKPEFLFADEPTGSLDSENSERIFSLFQKINKELKTTIVLITHEDDFAKRVDRNILLKDGSILNE